MSFQSLERETEITGPSAAKLFVSSSTPDADLFVVLRVFDPDGEEVTFQGAIDPHTPIGQGWLRASHRKLDPALSAPYRRLMRRLYSIPMKGRSEEVALCELVWRTDAVTTFLPPERPRTRAIRVTRLGEDKTFGNGDDMRVHVEVCGALFDVAAVVPYRCCHLTDEQATEVIAAVREAA